MSLTNAALEWLQGKRDNQNEQKLSRFMQLYLTESQVPELRDLPVSLRRVLVRRALTMMRAEARLFCSLPVMLCVIGGLVGSLVGAALLGCFYRSPAGLTADWISKSMVWSYSGVGIGSFLAGFIGLQLQRSKLRPYLGRAIREYASKAEQSV